MAKKHDLENLLNGELAGLLTDAGVPAQAEVKQGNRRLDVLADVDGLRVVLEAETGFDKQAQAIKDADARFKQGLTTLAFAVCYPSAATVDSLAASDLRWLLRAAETAGKPAHAGDWSGGSVQQLAEAVRQAPNSVADADKAAQMLSDGLNTAVQGLSTPVRMALAKRLDLPRGKKTASDDGYFTAAKRGMLVVAMAMLFHHRVHEHLPSERPTASQGDWPPMSAAECAAEPQGTPQRFGDSWAAILKVDYKPVFETARVALFALPTTPDTALVVHQLAKVIENIASSLHGGRDNRVPSYPQFSLDTLRSLQVPDFIQLGTDARDALATTYDWRQDDVLLPLPQMNDDPVRKQLDEAVTAALALDPEWVAQVRQALSEEPSVTNRRFGT